ncbi:hypothetical protein FRUB_06855 [Fimbriiglobus ruber]|uniref:Carboxypeptidase regulatory-like domain-containing protein n=2 Tax=Fimbriiglobus ruber TaxID=1908690 RepID=A0A225DMU5_9BACT|nr:hypothetical protein FRUB_06855 [Fimbriiglobus ruber]
MFGLAFLAAVSGCGEKGPPPGAPIGTPSPVHGTVTFEDGTPLKGGIVMFYPVQAEAGSKLRFDGASLVDAQGKYTAGRNQDGKGLVPGEYVVTVDSREVGELPGSNAARVPASFRDKKSSSLKITVDEKDNKIDIRMK